MLKSKNKILIVDDEPTNLIILKETLKDDYDIILAESGQQAIELTQKENPDLILLDVMMPQISGHEVCKTLKSNPLSFLIPIIFVSAMSETKDETYGFSIGAVDYITKPVHPAVVRARVKTHLSLVQTQELKNTRMQIIQSLGYAAEYKDNETGRHVIRMSHYSKILALASGYSEEYADVIFNAAPMHDIGKIGIPDVILQKPGKLTREEFDIIKTHPAIGAKILGKHSDRLLSIARDISLSHHEKWDGSGYPNGLRQKEISKESRIITIADVFDALTSERPYKKAWTIEETCNYIEDQAGKHFDPELVPLLIKQMPAILEVKEKWKENVSFM